MFTISSGAIPVVSEHFIFKKNFICVCVWGGTSVKVIKHFQESVLSFKYVGVRN